MKFINKNKNFEECIKNVCVYCMNLEKYQYLKDIYPKIHNDIYNKKINVENFINKYSSENIKPFPLTKLITYEDYIETYKERHLKIAEFYGDYNPELYEKSFKNISTIINEEEENNELKIKDKNKLFDGFSKFEIRHDIFQINRFNDYINSDDESNSDEINNNILKKTETNVKNNEDLKKYFNKDLEELDKLVIKEYTKDTIYGDLNKWLLSYKKNGYESVAYFTSRLMYSLNSYAVQNKKFYNKNNKNTYRGIKIPYTSLLPYERAKGKIIILSSFTSTSENKEKVIKFSGRNNSKELYKTNQLFSVLYIIKNKFKEYLVSNGINIQNESAYKKEEEILYQPFSFYYLQDVVIDLKNYTADIYLETIGKKQILEEIIKKGKEIIYNKEENIIEIEN